MSQSEIERLTAELADMTERCSQWQTGYDTQERDLATLKAELAEAKQKLKTMGHDRNYWKEHCDQREAERDEARRELAESRVEWSKTIAELAEARQKLKIPHPVRDFVNECNKLLTAKDNALAAAKEKHERELFDCGGINDAWAMELDKLKAELAAAKKHITYLANSMYKP